MLIHNLKSVPNIITKSQNPVSHPPAAVLQSIKSGRKPPKERLFREDELSKFMATDKINSIHDITVEKLKEVGQNFKITRQQDHTSIYCLKNNPDAIPQITYCIKIEQSLCVKLFPKGTSMPLPIWFRKGRNTHLTSWSMMPNLFVYIKEKAEEDKSLLDELESLKFKKRPHYSSHIVRYALELRYASLQAYKLLPREFNLP